MNFSELSSDSRRVPVMTAAGVLKATYRPSAVTPAFLSRYEPRLATSGTDSLSGLCEALSELLIEWDLFDDGHQLGTDAETMATLPVTVLKDIFIAIREDLAQGEAEPPSVAGGR